MSLPPAAPPGETSEVARVVALALAAEGVRVAFGMPGGDSLPLVRALADVGIRFVLVRDEASAGFAADATAQLTDGVGVCLSTLGPGLTNLASGVAGCTLDRAAVVAITARYRSDRRNLYTHMQLPQEEVLRATGKAWFRLGAAHAGAELRRALAVARAPRPGAVWVEIPTEVAAGTTADRPRALPPAPAPLPVSDALLDQVAGWERPVILVGFPGRRAAVAELAARWGAPVLTTYKAKGCVPESTGWSAGAVGLSPVADAVHQQLIHRADGLLLVGWDPVELRDHWLPGWSDAPEVVALDTCWPTDLPARLDAVHVGDVPAAVQSLIAASRRPASRWDAAEVEAHRGRHAAVFAEDVFGPAGAVRAVQEAVDRHPGVVATLDVGAHRITASHVWRCDAPDTLLQSNGWSSMGYGLPAALAAVAAGRPAVAMTGDMGLQLVAGELGTAAELGGTLVVVVFVDASLSLIALKQQRLAHPSRGVQFGNPDLPLLAEAFGGVGRWADDARSTARAVEEGLTRGGLTVVGVRIDPAPYLRQM